MRNYITGRTFLVPTGKMELAGLGPDGEPRFRAGSREIPAGSTVSEDEIGGSAEAEAFLADGLIRIAGSTS